MRLPAILSLVLHEIIESVLLLNRLVFLLACRLLHNVDLVQRHGLVVSELTSYSLLSELAVFIWLQKVILLAHSVVSYLGKTGVGLCSFLLQLLNFWVLSLYALNLVVVGMRLRFENLPKTLWLNLLLLLLHLLLTRELVH